ncbi:MAG: SDR family oxidoreductase [Pseudomonadota bacterium]
MGQFEGRHALITGGGTGMGRAIAERLMEEGAAVTVTGRRAEVLREVDGAFAVPMDVSEEASVVDGVAAARAQNGPVHICVANAGIAEGASLRDTDAAFWRRVMAINLDGCFYTFRACIPDMLEAGWGRAIAISSIMGLRGIKGALAYTTSKHGMVGMVRGLAADFVGKPLTVNAICPGYVETEIIDRNVDRIMARTGLSAEDARQVMVGANPHGRLIAASEVAETAAWLCSDASASVNGQAIQVSGGEV